MCKYPFGSGGKRVTTDLCLPVRRSSSMISSMKFSERGTDVVVIENRRSVKQFAAILILIASPALADDIERTVTMMAKIGSSNSPSFSADNKRIAFLTNITGTPQVWVISADGGYPDQVTALDDPVTAIEWSPNGEWIAM